MLNCQSCQTRLVLYSSQLDHSLQQLQDCLSEDSDGLIPDPIKADFLIQKQLRNLTPDVYIIPEGQVVAGINHTNNHTQNNNNNNNNNNTNPNFISGTITRQAESNQALIPTDGSLSFSIIEQRISKVSRLLSVLTNLTLIHNPLCPKCCHELNMKLTQYCTKLDNELETLLATQYELLQIGFKNDILTAQDSWGPSRLPATTEQRISHLLDQQIYHVEHFPAAAGSPTAKQGSTASKQHQLIQGVNDHLQAQDELLNDQLLSLYHEEQSLREELDQLDQELYLLQEEENELEQFTGYLSQLEDNFMSTFLDMKQAIAQHLTLTRTIQTKLEQQQAIHNSLSLTSPIFDLMSIDLQSPIPSISGFRLGRSEDCPVDWYEVNAGFGQIALLLDILRRTFGLNFKDTITLYPVGHRSYISKHGEISPLFRESNDHIKTQQFNRGLGVMLQCIQELYESQMYFITPIPSSIVMAPTTTPKSPTDLLQSNGLLAEIADGSSGLNGSTTETPTGSLMNNTRRQRDLAAGYQPQLQYQHQLPLPNEQNNNNNINNNGSASQSNTNLNSSSPSSPNGQMLYQQPQYDTAQYAQQIAKGGLPVTHMMSTQIQPPQIIYQEEETCNISSSPSPSSPIVSSAVKIASLPGVALSAVAPQAVFICSINNSPLNCESPGVWVNSMRQVLMALFQLMLLAVQRGV